ncbi:MAG: hypothetical protein IPN33_23140 [Saprospiraceae bacterium]|nr:hypothetical protein [Saprospiraceae bacterium]
MKTLLFCTSLIILFALSSCTTTEEIWINADGSLRQEVKIDMAALIPFMKMSENQMSAEAGVDTVNTSPDPFSEIIKRGNVDNLIHLGTAFEEELKKTGSTEENFWQQFNEEDNEKIPAEEKEAMKTLIKSVTNTRIRIKMNEAENIYFFSIIQDFKDISEMNSGPNALSMLQSLGGAGMGQDSTNKAMLNMMAGQTPAYSLKKNEFRISRPVYTPDNLKNEEEQAMQMFQLLGDAMQFEYLIHFPGKVKEVNIKDAEIIDGNTVRVKVPGKTGLQQEVFELVVRYK